MKKNIRITKLRTPETMAKYLQYNEDVKSGKVKYKLASPEDRAIKVFQHWMILENDFPYDTIAEKSHMLFTRRKVDFDWDLLTQEERDELKDLKKNYLSENYDVVYENLPKGQSVPGHFHVHLLVIKVTEF